MEEASVPVASDGESPRARPGRPPAHPSLADAATVGFGVLSLSSFIFLLVEAPLRADGWIFVVHYVVRTVVGILCMGLCRVTGNERVLTGAVLAYGALVSASSAHLGIVRGDESSNAIISVAICVAAAAILPWGWRETLALVSIFVVGLIVDAGVVHGGFRQSLQINVMLAIVTSMTGALCITITMGRARREVERRQREDEEAIARLTEDLERRVHERTAALEKVNAALAGANAELAEANRELQGFTYSVSHDLRGALRVIGGYSHLVAEQYAPRLDAQGRHFVEQIRGGAIRIGQYVDALLALARVSRTKLRYERVDLSLMAADVVAAMREGEPARTVTVEIERDLATEGDPSLLRILLENLLVNAWKFTRKRGDAARIEVGSRREGDEIAYFVSDNGVGFDMRDAAKLFTPFERLHEESDFEGTGIGLATVQSVVSRHGGRVWAEAAAGRGATFVFTLGSLAPRLRATG